MNSRILKYTNFPPDDAFVYLLHDFWMLCTSQCEFPGPPPPRGQPRGF